MSKKLAIRGHSTRGKEVIELLEMMGGKNNYKVDGANINCTYIIRHFDHSIIGGRSSSTEIVFTLEEFLEKFPFRIDDFVNIPEYESEVGICGMLWDPLCKRMEYMVYRNDDEEWYTAEELLEYNDNPNEPSKDTEEKDMTKSIDDVYSISECKTIGQGTYAIKIANGYKFDSIDENGNIIVKSFKPEPTYPTTYKECCDVLHIPPYYNLWYHTYEPGYAEFTTSNELLSIQDKLNILGKLLICRGAYWKIAGEEMGLGKPWEPDWKNDEQGRYMIMVYENELHKDRSIVGTNFILVFPTEEMRDVFYENFKDLIEQCKELL